VDKPGKAMTPNRPIATAASTTGASAGSIDRRIRAFLNGKTHGEDVLDALYGHITDEPLPAKLRAILKR